LPAVCNPRHSIDAVVRSRGLGSEPFAPLPRCASPHQLPPPPPLLQIAAIARDGLSALVRDLTLPALAVGDTWPALTAFLPHALQGADDHGDDSGEGDASEGGSAAALLAFQAMHRLAVLSAAIDGTGGRAGVHEMAAVVADWVSGQLPAVLHNGMSETQTDTGVATAAAYVLAGYAGVPLLEEVHGQWQLPRPAAPIPRARVEDVADALAHHIREEGDGLGVGAGSRVVLVGTAGVRYATLIASLAHAHLAEGASPSAHDILATRGLIQAVWRCAVDVDDPLTAWAALALLPPLARAPGGFVALVEGDDGPWAQLLSAWGAGEELVPGPGAAAESPVAGSEHAPPPIRVTWEPSGWDGTCAVAAMTTTAGLVAIGVELGLPTPAQAAARAVAAATAMQAAAATACARSGLLHVAEHDVAATLQALAAAAASHPSALAAILSAPHAADAAEWLELAMSSSETLRAGCLLALATLFTLPTPPAELAAVGGGISAAAGGAGAVGVAHADPSSSLPPSPYPHHHTLWQRVGEVFRRPSGDVLADAWGRTPHPEVRFAAYSVATALASLPDPTGWNLKALFGHTGIAAHVLRPADAEATKLGKEAAYGVVAAAARNPFLASSLGAFFAGQITAAAAKGPLAVDRAGPLVTVA